MLIEFFVMNKISDKTKKLIYEEFPKYFFWNQQDKIWTIWKKKKKGNIISRIVTVNSIDSERYYLRLLLNHIRGATSFQHLKNVNGIETSWFREAAQLHGLLEGDDNIELCLKEASFYQMSYILHCLFATILIYCKLNNMGKLWTSNVWWLCFLR